MSIGLSGLARSFLVAAVLALAACASAPPSAPAEAPEEPAPATAGFTPAELVGLQRCSNLAGEAFLMATFKLQGLSLEQARDRHAGRSTDTLSALESVYRSTFGSPWEFSKEYFRTCAQRSAGIDSMTRLQTPTLCIWNLDVALVARTQAQAGQPIESVRRQLGFSSSESEEIVAGAYRTQRPARDYAADTWNRCLGITPGG